MSAYLVHRTYYRFLQPEEMLTAIEDKRGLLLLDKNGDPRYIIDPKKYAVDEWMKACAAGRVLLAWATRWTTADEISENALPIAPPAEEKKPEVPAEPAQVETPMFP